MSHLKNLREQSVILIWSELQSCCNWVFRDESFRSVWLPGSVWVLSWKFHWNKHFLIKDFSFKTIVLASVGRRSRAGNLSQNIPNQNNFYLNRIIYLPATCVKGWLPHKEKKRKWSCCYNFRCNVGELIKQFQLCNKTDVTRLWWIFVEF